MSLLQPALRVTAAGGGWRGRNRMGRTNVDAVEECAA
jgi:hypothetical protein